jgi:hypothetical protein
MSGEFGIDVPDGDPGALEGAAADLRGAAGVLGRTAGVLESSGSVSGWSGTASMTFQDACVTDAAVAASADGTLQMAGLVLIELADALRQAKREAQDAIEEAREAKARREAADRDAEEATARAAAAGLAAEAAGVEIAARSALGDPAAGVHAALDAAQRDRAVAQGQVLEARKRSARAQEDFDAAVERGRRVVERYERYGDRVAVQLTGLAGMAPAVTPLAPAAPPQPASSHEDGGGILTGLGKGFEDVWDEATGLVTGAANHVNVFDPDTLADTWSNDWAVAGAIWDDPVGAGKVVVSSAWAPIRESYEHGGVDEAGARAVPSLIGTVLGGKGLSKLGRLGEVDGTDTAPSASRPGDGTEAPGGDTARDGPHVPKVAAWRQHPDHGTTVPRAAGRTRLRAAGRC